MVQPESRKRSRTELFQFLRLGYGLHGEWGSRMITARLYASRRVTAAGRIEGLKIEESSQEMQESSSVIGGGATYWNTLDVFCCRGTQSRTWR